VLRFCLLILLTYLFLAFQVSAEKWIPFSGYFRTYSYNDERTIKYVEHRNGSRLNVKISIPGIFLDAIKAEKKDYAKVRIPGEGYTAEIGKAKIPVIRRLVRVSENSDFRILNVNTECELCSLSGTELREIIYPLQESYSKGRKEKPEFKIDSSFYKTNAFTGKAIAKAGKLLKIKGKSYRILEIFPFSYNPAKNNLRIYSEIDISIETGIVTETVASRTPLKGMVILVWEEFLSSPYFREYAKWKEETGYRVKIIPSYYAGRDDKEIRSFLLEEYKKWKDPGLDYLLIIGDTEYIPAHYGKTFNTRQYTDNYYATLDTKSYMDDITTPDVVVGRISIKTDYELSVVLNRILRYERADFSSYDWLKKVSFIGTSDPGYYHLVEATHNYVIENYTGKNGFTGNFPGRKEKGGDRLYAVTHRAEKSDLITAFRDGRVIINYSGHGEISNWVAPAFFHEDIFKLDHTDAMPYVISNACFTGSFAGMTSDSFAEMWLKAENGAIAFYGASNNSYWKEDDILEKRMWEHLLVNKAHRTGDINFYGLEKMRLHFNNSGKVPYYYEIYNLIGDPTVPLFTEIPRELKIYPGSLMAGKNSYRVKVEDSRGPVRGAKVYMSIGKGGISDFAVTSEDGIAFLSFNTIPSYDETVKITASAVNHVPISKNFQFEDAADRAYFVIDGYEINSDSGRIVPFESFPVRLRIKNIGGMPGSAKFSISSLSQGLEFEGSKSDACDGMFLEPGESRTCPGELKFFPGAAYKDGSYLSVEMIAKFTGGENNLELLMPVSYSNYIFTDITIAEVKGNYNGIPEPGDYLNIFVKVKNDGSQVSHEDLIEMILPDSCIEKVFKVGKKLPPLLPGDEIEKSFMLRVLDSCDVGAIAKFSVEIKSSMDKEAILSKHEFSQVIGE